MITRPFNTASFSLSKSMLLWSTIVLTALMLSGAILSNRLFIIMALAGIVVYLRLSIHIKILLLALGALFPISFGPLGPIPNFYWFEWMAPVLAGLLAVNLALFERKRLLIKGNAWLYSAFAALAVTVVVNYTRNPVLAQKLMGVAEQAGGLRSYYDIAAGICLTFVVLWYLTYYLHDKKIIRRFLTVVAIFSIGIGLFQLAAFFFDFQLPFLYSTFRSDSRAINPAIYGGTAFRIGGLSECAIIGMSAILGLSYGKKLGSKEIIALGLCAVLLILSGGRAHACGALMAVGIYAGLSGAKRAMVLITGGLLLVCLFWLLASSGVLGGQWERYTTVTKGYEAIDQWRDLSYRLMLESIYKNPVFGKGIGYVGASSNRAMDFALDQLKVGGHGAYLSILSLFGVFGLYFLTTTLAGGILKGLAIVRRANPIESSLAMFCLMLLIISAVSYVAGGNGYSDMRLYLCIGILAGLTRKGACKKNEV